MHTDTRKGLIAIGVGAAFLGAAIWLGKKSKAAIADVTIRFVNPPDNISALWGVLLMDPVTLTQAAFIHDPNDDGAAVRPLTTSLAYTVPENFTYPLVMVLLFQEPPYDVIWHRQSLGLGYPGSYDPALVIPAPGAYGINYYTYLITPL